MKVEIQAVGNMTAETVSPSGAPVGLLVGRRGEVVGDSPTYNSSYLVEIDGETHDIHDQHLKAIDKPEA